MEIHGIFMLIQMSQRKKLDESLKEDQKCTNIKNMKKLLVLDIREQE